MTRSHRSGLPRRLPSGSARAGIATPATTKSPTLSVVAGQIAGGCADGKCPTVGFLHPTGVCLAPSGDLYIVDSGNNTIRKLTPAGEVTTFAGEPGRVGSADGTGAAARFNDPSAIAVDGAGNLYVADSANNTIRKITPSGACSTLAGKPGVTGSADGLGAAASFNSPFGLALDLAGNLYVADSCNNTIRKIASTGQVSTFAGTPGVLGSADGQGAAASFNNLNFMTMDGQGNLYAADSNNNTIRKITPSGMVSTLAGSPGQTGTADGTGAAARFHFPYGLAMDASDNLYVTDAGSCTIRKVTPAGVVTTQAGTASQDGWVDGAGAAARFFNLEGLASDPAGNLYAADFNSIRAVTPTAVVTTLAGSGPTSSVDGPGPAARFSGIGDFGVARDGHIFVPDADEHTIRMISPAGLVSTLAGAKGVPGSADGPLASARFSSPTALAADKEGNLYIADFENHTIRKITQATGLVSTLAGTAGNQGSADGTGAAASFGRLHNLVVDLAGNVYVTEGANTIRKITPSGQVTTLAGSPGQQGSADGTGAAASFDDLEGIAVDASGNLYVSDFFNDTIRKVTPAGVVTTLAGKALSPGSADGTGADARFSGPEGLALSPSGNLLVADTWNNTIRMVTPSGAVTTVAGNAERMEAIPGAQPGAWFSPCSLALDPATGDLLAGTTMAILRIKV